MYVIFGINTTHDISKLPQISLTQMLVKLRITILKYHSRYLCQISLQIMLLPIQTVMVSPGTHLVKNYESQSRTNESQFKKKKVWNWKYLGLYVTRPLIWRQTPKLCITLNNNIVLLFKSTTKAKRNMHS